MRLLLQKPPRRQFPHRHHYVPAVLLPRWLHWLKNLSLSPYKLFQEHFLGGESRDWAMRFAKVVLTFGTLFLTYLTHGRPIDALAHTFTARCAAFGIKSMQYAFAMVAFVVILRFIFDVGKRSRRTSLQKARFRKRPDGSRSQKTQRIGA